MLEPKIFVVMCLPHLVDGDGQIRTNGKLGLQR